jgi:hypothetical protein
MNRPQQQWEQKQPEQQQQNQLEPVAVAETGCVPVVDRDSEWTEVTKKGMKKKLAKEVPNAFIVKVNEDKTYADTLRNLKKGLVDAGLTDEIGMTKKTASGDLLLQMSKRINKTTQVRDIVEKITGTETHHKTNNVAVEIRGLDADATPEELATAISERATIQMTTENIKAIKSDFQGKATAVVLLPARVTN